MDGAAGNDIWVASDLSDLGRAANARGDLTVAQDVYSRSLTIRERLAPNSLDVAVSLNGLGNVATNRGDLDGAQGYFTRAVTIQERLASDSLPMAAYQGNLGIVAFERGDFSVAHDHHIRALAIREQLAPDSLEVAASLNNLGMVAWIRGDLAAAHGYHSRSLAIKERLAPGSLSMAASFTNLGNVASDRGDQDATWDYQSRALAIREKLAPNSLDLATSLNNLGNVARNRGELAAAQDYHARALAIRERLAPNSLSVAMSLHNAGDIARTRGDPATAQDYYRRSLAIKEVLSPNSLNVAVSLTGLGSVAGARGNSAEALDYHRRALSIRERLAPGSLALAASLNTLGGIALKEGRYVEALPLLTSAVDIVEARRWEIRTPDARALLLAQYAEASAGLLATHVGLGNLPAAFETAERTRARSLLEHLSEPRAEIRQGVDAVVLKNERQLQRQINDKARQQTQILAGRHTAQDADRVKRELDALLAQYQNLQAQIRTESPRYAALTQPQPLGLSEIQRDVLEEGTLLLEYALGDERSHLFAVTTTSIRSFVLPARAQIDQASRRVYDALIARQQSHDETPMQRRARIEKADADYPAAAAALSRMILEPVAAQLSGQRLLIVADGALQYVPFAALPRPGQPASMNAEPLMVKPRDRQSAVGLNRSGPAQRASRTSTRGANSRRARRSGVRPAGPASETPPRASTHKAASLPADITRAARAAGLTDDRGGLARLPFTRDEADAIMALAPGGSGTRAVDFSASRATMTSAAVGRARIVHIATHGLLDAEHPELSGLVLSLVDEQGRPQDGFLRLHEVYNLNWSADLVVLSACQTALGKEIKGEGLVGLTRGFMYGGAERVMASLWNVNDSATAQLMTRFYAGLLGKGMTPAAALRAAQVEMWRRQPARSPYFWSAFVLQGDWR